MNNSATELDIKKKIFRAKFENEFFNSWAIENQSIREFDEKWYP